MKTEFRVRWQAKDGYVGGRPQSFTVSADDIEDDMTDNNLRDLFCELLQSDFEEKVSPASDMEDEFVGWALEVLASRQEKEEDQP